MTDSLQNKIGTKRDNQSKTKMFHGIKYHCGSRMFDRDFVEEGPPVDTQVQSQGPNSIVIWMLLFHACSQQHSSTFPFVGSWPFYFSLCRTVLWAELHLASQSKGVPYGIRRSGSRNPRDPTRSLDYAIAIAATTLLQCTVLNQLYFNSCSRWDGQHSIQG